MRLLLAAALLLVTPAQPLVLEIRTFDGFQDVTRETRITVHRAGDRGQPIGLVPGGTEPALFHVPPGIYDAQAIQERQGRVVNIRWAERLVVMPYRDEGGHHLQVINLRDDFGALQVRRAAGEVRPTDFTLFRADDRLEPLAPAAASGSRYVLFVVPAGTYDLRVTRTTGEDWHTGLEVPRSRTRLWVAP